MTMIIIIQIINKRVEINKIIVIVYGSTIGCFHIKKYSSIINVTPIEYPLEKKIYTYINI